MMALKPSAFFPPADSADDTGLVCITPTMTPQMVLDAYRHGIFPWSENPVRWFSPEPRAVFLWEEVRLPKKVGKLMRRHGLKVTFDTAFRRTIQACSDAHREAGEWISPLFIDTYETLHHQGHAHSVEVWQGEELVGGLYGIQLGAMFAGESMFHTVSDASKVAFAFLVAHLQASGVLFIDAQVLNPHTYRLGALLVRRDEFLKVLDYALQVPARHEGERWPERPQALPPGTQSSDESK